ncbi:MAG: DNA repair protein RadC [Ruminococcaceae bacterium]|nr:DNA repair protein RadC [Oscillospiraceae bacterium]
MENNFTMKCLPESDRPYEKLERNGAYSLTDSELLAVIIQTGTPKSNAIDVARQLISLCGENGLSAISDLGIKDLMRIDGIGRVKALKLYAVCELSKRMSRKNDIYKMYVKNTAMLADFLVSELSSLKKEVFRTVILDLHKKVIRMTDVSIGTIDTAVVHPREVFFEAIKFSGHSMVVAHNHPGGAAVPSAADLKTTERLIISGEIIGIEVLDHIIVAGHSYYSMLERGDMDRLRKKISNGFV